MKEVGNFRVALSVLLSRLSDMNTRSSIDALKEWDHYRGMDWVEKTTVETVKSAPTPYGYAVLNKITKERFPTSRGCYDSKGGAATGFNRITVKGWYALPQYAHLKGLKLSEQDEYAVYPLVIADE